MLDSVGVGFQVDEELCFKLESRSNEVTKRKYILVSRTAPGDNAFRAQIHVSRQKLLHSSHAFRMDLVQCLQTRSIAELDIVCGRVHEIEHPIQNYHTHNSLESAKSSQAASSVEHRAFESSVQR